MPRKMNRATFLGLTASAGIGAATLGIGGAARAVPIEAIPGVYMGMCFLTYPYAGAPEGEGQRLATETPADWYYTRKNLNGFWFNAAGTTNEDVVTVMNLVDANSVIVPVFAPDPQNSNHNNFWQPGEPKNYKIVPSAWNRFLNIRDQTIRTIHPWFISLDALSIYESGSANQIPGLIREIRNDPYFEENRIIVAAHVDWANSNGTIPPSVANIINASDGIVVELSSPRMWDYGLGRWKTICNYVRARGKAVMWLVPRGIDGETSNNLQPNYATRNFLPRLKQCIGWMRNNNCVPTSISPVNYGAYHENSDPLRLVPEFNCSLSTEANTFTGACRWLLRFA